MTSRVSHGQYISDRDSSLDIFADGHTIDTLLAGPTMPQQRRGCQKRSEARLDDANSSWRVRGGPANAARLSLNTPETDILISLLHIHTRR